MADWAQQLVLQRLVGRALVLLAGAYFLVLLGYSLRAGPSQWLPQCSEGQDGERAEAACQEQRLTSAQAWLKATTDHCPRP